MATCGLQTWQTLLINSSRSAWLCMHPGPRVCSQSWPSVYLHCFHGWELRLLSHIPGSTSYSTSQGGETSETLPFLCCWRGLWKSRVGVDSMHNEADFDKRERGEGKSVDKLLPFSPTYGLFQDAGVYVPMWKWHVRTPQTALSMVSAIARSITHTPVFALILFLRHSWFLEMIFHYQHSISKIRSSFPGNA